MKMKFLGILLSFALMLTMMPTLSLPAFATGGPQPSVSVLPENSGSVATNYLEESHQWELNAIPEEGYEFDEWTYTIMGNQLSSYDNPIYIDDSAIEGYSDLTVHFKQAAVSYGLWVGNTAVTDKKTSGEGWSYDVKSKTLTLDGFVYEGPGHIWIPEEGYYGRSSVIFAEDDLTVNLKGTSTIKNTDSSDDNYVYSIFSKKSVTINGNGTLELPDNGDANGVYSSGGDLTINNATIINNANYGIDSYGDCTINNSTIESTVTAGGSIYTYDGDLEVNDSTITVTSYYECIDTEDGSAVFNNSEVSVTSSKNEGLDIDGNLIINNSNITTSSSEDDAIYAIGLEMNSGRVEATGSNAHSGIDLENGDAKINGGTIVASGRYGINTDRSIYFNGGDVTLTGSGDGQGLYAERKVILSDRATVKAGDDEKSATDVTSTFAKVHDQKWAHISVAPDPKPTPDDPTAVGTVHSVPSRVGKYVITSANTVSLVKAPNRKSYTIPATVKISGKIFKVTGINAKAFEGKKVKTLYIKTKKLTKKSVKNSLKKSKIKTVKVKVGKKKTNKKYVKKYKKIFTKKNCGKKVRVK